MNPISEKIEKFLNESKDDKTEIDTTSPHDFKKFEITPDEAYSKMYHSPHSTISFHRPDKYNSEVNYDFKHVFTHKDLKKLHKTIGDHLSKIDDKATKPSKYLTHQPATNFSRNIAK